MPNCKVCKKPMTNEWFQKTNGICLMCNMKPFKYQCKPYEIIFVSKEPLRKCPNLGSEKYGFCDTCLNFLKRFKNIANKGLIIIH